MDDFYEKLCEVLNETLKLATTELSRVRRENTQLREQIAALPATATELQDRVTMLESQLHPEQIAAAIGAGQK